MKHEDILKRAKHKLKTINMHKRDPRFKEVLGRLVALKLLDNPKALPYHGPISLKDVLWAGQWEPRILELLPAILLKKPKVINADEPIPEDLREVLNNIRKNEDCMEFRGIPAADYLKWISTMGHKGKLPSLLKTYRFNAEDLAVLRNLRKRINKNEIDIIRLALQQLAASPR